MHKWNQSRVELLLLLLLQMLHSAWFTRCNVRHNEVPRVVARLINNAAAKTQIWLEEGSEGEGRRVAEQKRT